MKDPEKVFIFGAGGNTIVLLDAIERCGHYDVQFLLDDCLELEGKEVYGCQVVARQDEQEGRIQQAEGMKCIVSIGNNQIRKDLFMKMLARNISFFSVVHPMSIIGRDVKIDDGCMIMPGAIVNAGTRIGRGGLLNTRCSIDHECMIGDFVHIGPGATLCGAVTVGEGAFVGAGATVIPGVAIGAWAVVGAGATVVRDVAAGATVIGTPAERVVK